MYEGKTICAVVPAYNEGRLLSRVLDSMPALVDKILVVDDCSTDNTRDVALEQARKDERIQVIRHERNAGVGAAIATGYKAARDRGADVAVVMAGDGQMDPGDLPAILDPVARGTCDYSKGNRLFTGEAYRKIPRVRFFGNAVLSLLTKIASGYWNVADSQSGYTAINRRGLERIDWDRMYKRYGQPNDILVRLNIEEMRVRDVPVKPVYNIGEESGIRIPSVVFSIGWLLLKLFVWRMKEKYVIRDFHPLIFFYALGVLFFLSTVLLGARLTAMWMWTGSIPPINALGAMFSFMSCSLFTVFAMWFDMETNRHLQ